MVEIWAALIGAISKLANTFLQAKLFGDKNHTANPSAGSKIRERFKRLDGPILISFADKNRQRIGSDFLGWQQCTIMMWVFVTAKGSGLRRSPANHYLLAHETGLAYEDEHDTYHYNQFSVRYSSKRECWEIQFSNDAAKYFGYDDISIKDGLSQGWHQFLIAWDHGKPKLTFRIDGETGGNDLNTDYLRCWPKGEAQTVSIGSWPSDDWEHGYCETKVAALWIVDRFLEPSDAIVREHLGLKPPAI